MIDAPLLILGGLLGSAHCVGMCGSFVLTISVRGQRPTSELLRQLTYASGRVFTYTVAGATAGFVGAKLASILPTAIRAQGWLCVLAGLILLYQGAIESGLWRRTPKAAKNGCIAPSLFGALWNAVRWQNNFVAGVLNGLLPCGLVYAFLALAGSTRNLWTGAATMAFFGLGTIPALAILGVGGGCLSHPMRRRVHTLAAWCVIVTGAISVTRGAAFLTAHPDGDTAIHCPLCDPPHAA